MIRMFVKLGVSPFHSWFISILKTRPLKILFILSSVQKFIPLVILNNIIFNYIVFYMIVFLNLIILIYILFSTIYFIEIDNNIFYHLYIYVIRSNFYLWPDKTSKIFFILILLIFLINFFLF